MDTLGLFALLSPCFFVDTPLITYSHNIVHLALKNKTKQKYTTQEPKRHKIGSQIGLISN